MIDWIIDDWLILWWLIDDWLFDWWFVDSFLIDKAGVLKQFVEHGIEWVAGPNIIVGHEEGKINEMQMNKASVILHIILVLYLYITYNV